MVWCAQVTLTCGILRRFWVPGKPEHGHDVPETTIGSPHACGEDVVLVDTRGKRTGSPPHVWRRP